MKRQRVLFANGFCREFACISLAGSDRIADADRNTLFSSAVAATQVIVRRRIIGTTIARTRSRV
jgi:hypothetical protein